MAKYSAQEYRAITWFALENNLKMTLCQRPYVFYVDEDGDTEGMRISEVIDAWEAHKRQDRNQKARQYS